MYNWKENNEKTLEQRTLRFSRQFRVKANRDRQTFQVTCGVRDYASEGRGSWASKRGWCWRGLGSQRGPRVVQGRKPRGPRRDSSGNVEERYGHMKATRA